MKRKIDCNPPLPIASILKRQPHAEAVIHGSSVYCNIHGIVRFYQTSNGTIIHAELTNLPKESSPCKRKIFGFHIHSGRSCTGNEKDPFADAEAHYDTNTCEHPFHAGDLPPLFGNNGKALSIFLTSRFTVEEVLGRTIIIHDSPDDFTTQPSGNSGNKIACGVIRKTAKIR